MPKYLLLTAIPLLKICKIVKLAFRKQSVTIKFQRQMIFILNGEKKIHFHFRQTFPKEGLIFIVRETYFLYKTSIN